MSQGIESPHGGIRATIVEEFKKLLPPTIFFAVGFNLIVLTQRMLLAD